MAASRPSSSYPDVTSCRSAPIVAATTWRTSRSSSMGRSLVERLGAAGNLPDGDLTQFVGALGAAWLGRQRLARADLAKGQAASLMLEEQEKIAEVDPYSYRPVEE